ncbi:MAG: hypothetical protein HPY55_07235 [Firmicutes bacterium]|nr:hypothetical protein [Bacillota bacterium]
MGRAGSTFIQWDDYEGHVYLQTTSGKLVETLTAVGVVWEAKDDAGTYSYRIPTAWLRLRIPRGGILKFGWYPTKKQKGVLAIMEERPKLVVVK